MPHFLHPLLFYHILQSYSIISQTNDTVSKYKKGIFCLYAEDYINPMKGIRMDYGN